MTTVVLNPDFEELLAGLSDTRLFDLSLDFRQELGNFVISESFLVGNPSLSATGLTAQFESRDPTDVTLYTFRISGSGIAPSSTLDALADAIDAGTANGTLSQVTIDYGSARIATFDIAPQSLTLTSGTQSLELTGGFPVTLAQLIDLEAILSGREDGSLSEYGFTGLSLRDDGEELIGLQTGDTLTFALDGFTLTLEGADIRVEDLFDFIDPGRAQIVPTLAIYDSTGQLVTDGVQPITFPWSEQNEAEILFEVPDGGGTFFIEVGASSEEVVSWQTETGIYQLFSSFWGFTPDFNVQTFEDMGDAPASVDTPYVLNSGANFTGAIDFAGDLDWIRVDLPEPFTESGFPNYSAFDDVESVFGAVRFSVFGIGQADRALSDLTGIGFTGLTLTAPDGTEILRADDVSSWADFLTELDSQLTPFEFPSLADLPLAFATGDPHLLTLDGLGYDFHAAGEYVLTRATDGSKFEVQARMAPAGENVTANIAAAVQLDGGAVMVDARGMAHVTLDGVALDIDDQSSIDIGMDRIYRDGDSYILVHTRDGSMETGFSAVVVTLVGSRVDIGVALDDVWMGNVEGLLGNFNGDPTDDLVLADGTPLTTPLVFGDDPDAGIWGVYGQFREDWRVDDNTTLFSYAAGEGPDSFYLPDYPTRMITLEDFSTEERTQAEAQAQAAGLTPGTFAFNNAVLDLLLTGDESFLDSAMAVNDAVTERNDGDATAGVSAPEVAGGGLEGLLTLSGRLTDLGGDGLTGAKVTFQPTGRSVALTRLTRDSDQFSFDLSEGASGRVEVTRDYQAGADPSITALDALDVLRMAVGLTPSFGPAVAQNFIAADINGDGQITALDALEVLRAAVGLQSSFAPRWVFFDADTDFGSMELSRNDVSVQSGIDISALSADQTIDMTGILLGNMEGVA